MTRPVRNTSHRWVTMPAIFFVVYVVSYLLTTEIYRGQLGGTRLRIRLFHSAWHQWFFNPLLGMEERLRPATPEFSSQVRNGASLPPAEP